MILLIDNYDSFTYNLYQMIRKYRQVKVVRNDEITVKEVKQMDPEAIIISPGPKTPSEAGICKILIEKLYDKYPILGICLGHQCIYEVFGGTVKRAPRIVHGKVSTIYHEGTGLFNDFTGVSFEGVRYHSLIGDPNTLPKELVITSATELGEIMSIAHKEYPVYGLQFHPESYLTLDGKHIIKNFIKEVENVS